MKKLLILVATIVASIALYFCVFSVVDRPLTLGDLTRQLDIKLSYASKLSSPKLVILAGSNGRYSHRCARFAAALNLPCANASIASGIGLDFLLDQYRTILRRGDFVYMPLEFGQYAASEAESHLGVQNAVLLRHRREYLWSLPAGRIVETFGAFDLPFLIRGTAEMALARTNFRRRTGIDTLTEAGDEKDHTAEKAMPYAEFLTHAPAPDPRIPDRSFAETILTDFLAGAKRDGITVIGGLPTVPEDTAITPEDVARIRQLFVAQGQYFVVTPSRSRYPRSCFYDGTYHLNETCQIAHSAVVAEVLRAQIPGMSNNP